MIDQYINIYLITFKRYIHSFNVTEKPRSTIKQPE